MNLFNRKTLAKYIVPSPLPADHLTALTDWAEMIRSGRVYSLKEVALYGQFAAKIIEGILGYQGPTGGADYTVATEQTILRGSVDLALGRFGGPNPEILASFELKGADTRAQAPAQDRHHSGVQRRAGQVGLRSRWYRLQDYRVVCGLERRSVVCDRALR